MGVTRNSTATEAAIIEAAGELFAARGFAAVTARQVARQAGVALGAIPYHFGSMQALYRAVLFRACECFSCKGDRATSLVDRTPGECLRNLVAMVLEDYSGPLVSWPSRILTREEMDPSEAFQDVVKLRYAPQWEWACQMVGRATGRSPKGEAVHFGVISLYAQVDALFTRGWLINGFAPEVRARLADQNVMVELLMALTLQAVEQYPSFDKMEKTESRRKGRPAKGDRPS